MNRGFFCLGCRNYFLQWVCIFVHLLNPQTVEHREWILASTLTCYTTEMRGLHVEWSYVVGESTFLLHFGVDIKLL